MRHNKAPQTRPGGRTERNRRAIIQAAADLLAESSPAEITVAQIAERACVNEATIYRKWGTKDALYSDVLLTLSSERLVMTDTGSLRGDLLQVIGGVAAFLRTPAGYSLAFLGATGEDATTATLRDVFWEFRFAKAQAIFDRAVVRGEIPNANAAHLAYEALIGALHFRILARRSSLDKDIAERLVEMVLNGVLPR